MFDMTIDDPRDVLRIAESAQRRSRLAAVDVLGCALAWADLHGVVGGSDVGLPGAARLRRFGGVGTPEVDDLSVASFAVALGMPAGSAARLIGDALDLRHRLPLFWQVVQDGEVEPWVARRIATITRPLDNAQAALVDAKAARYASRLPVNRLLACVGSWVYAAAPGLAGEEVERARDEHGVWIARDGDHGTSTLVVRGEAADIVAFDSAVDRVADGLGLLGSVESKGIRRARGVGVLASPQQALDLYAAAELAARNALTGCAGAAQAGTTAAAPDASLAPSSPVGPDPEPLTRGESIKVDPRPKAVLYVHLASETLDQVVDFPNADPDHPVARVEGIGPATVGQVRRWLMTRSVTVKPVIDLAGIAPVDSYEIPDRIREATRLAFPADAFPYAASTTADPDQAAGPQGFDLDHSTPYRSPNAGGPPGQTGVGTLAPLRRGGHRAKTHAGWTSAQPFPGFVIWRSPHGAVLATTPSGTHHLN